MQTFLPYENFVESARCLDNKRLGKQRVEAWQIYLSLTQPYYGWKNHPAVKMWKGSEPFLLLYGIKICDEWIRRGFKDTVRERFILEFEKYYSIKFSGPKMVFPRPVWLGDEDFHRSHRARLHQKDSIKYANFSVDDEGQDYLWPTKMEKYINK